MQIDTSKLTANWKSSAMGLCVLLIATLHFVKFDASGHLQMTARDWCGALSGVLGQIVGVLMNDAGTTQAITSSGEVKPVASHEVPNDPNDTAVMQ